MRLCSTFSIFLFVSYSIFGCFKPASAQSSYCPPESLKTNEKPLKNLQKLQTIQQNLEKYWVRISRHASTTDTVLDGAVKVSDEYPRAFMNVSSRPPVTNISKVPSSLNNLDFKFIICALQSANELRKIKNRIENKELLNILDNYIVTDSNIPSIDKTLYEEEFQKFIANDKYKIYKGNVQDCYKNTPCMSLFFYDRLSSINQPLNEEQISFFQKVYEQISFRIAIALEDLETLSSLSKESNSGLFEELTALLKRSDELNKQAYTFLNSVTKSSIKTVKFKY